MPRMSFDRSGHTFPGLGCDFSSTFCGYPSQNLPGKLCLERKISSNLRHSLRRSMRSAGEIVRPTAWVLGMGHKHICVERWDIRSYFRRSHGPAKCFLRPKYF